MAVDLGDFDFVSAAEAPYKVILCGTRGVGKTTLLGMLQRSHDVDFEPENRRLNITSSGVSSRGKTKVNIQTLCENKTVQVQVWDTGNMEAHSGSVGVTRSYFRDAHAAILIYKRGDEDSKQDLRHWIESTIAESPKCVLSIWCNNCEGTFGGGSITTRNIVDDIVHHFQIDQRLVFTYSPGRDVETVHDHFNTLVCKVYSTNPDVIRRDSIIISQSTHQQKKTTKCICRKH